MNLLNTLGGYQRKPHIEDIRRLFLNEYLSERSNTGKKLGYVTKKLNITAVKTFFSYMTENNDNNR